MRNETLKKFKAARTTVIEGKSRYGTLQPRLEIQFQKGTHYRRVMAALLALASEAELATPVTEKWGIEIEDRGDDAGRLFLELADGDTAEALRGMAFLQQLAG